MNGAQAAHVLAKSNTRALDETLVTTKRNGLNYGTVHSRVVLSEGLHLGSLA